MKKEKDILYDFGEWTIPTRWEEVSLEQFTKLMNKIENGMSDIREIISILSNKEINEVNMLPVDFVESMMGRLTFLNKAPEQAPNNEIIVNGEKYLINVMDKLKFGEYVDVNTAIQSDKTNYAAFLAILCRKEGEEYNDDFIANELDNRIKMFNSLPITDIIPVVGFFLALYQTSETYSQASLTEAKQSINQLLQETENIVKGGDCKKRSSIWRMKTLWKLRKYKKQISQL